MKTRILVWGLVLCGVVSIVSAAETYVDIERRLTPEQLHATGLDTLTPEQLSLLNTLLREERSQALQAVEAEARQDAVRTAADPGAPRSTQRIGLDDGPIRSRVRGDVAGWQPGDVFVLENGQQWQVLKGTLRLGQPRHAPEVLVVPGVAGRWFLQLDEDLPKARVFRID